MTQTEKFYTSPEIITIFLLFISHLTVSKTKTHTSKKILKRNHKKKQVTDKALLFNYAIAFEIIRNILKNLSPFLARCVTCLCRV